MCHDSATNFKMCQIDRVITCLLISYNFVFIVWQKYAYLMYCANKNYKTAIP